MSNYDEVEEVDPREFSDKAGDPKMELHDWLQCIVSAVVLGIFIFVFIGRTIGVQGYSMGPTLHYYDRVIMTNLFYTPSNGDIVIFRSESERFSDPLVKRVVAVAGQTVDIDFETGDVYVDGVVQYEPYISEPTAKRHDFIGPLTVPEGYVFVLGDNRNNSSDSRDSAIGLVDTRHILGRVLFVIIPGAEPGNSRDWSRIGTIRA